MLWVVKQRDLWGDFGPVLISGFARRDSLDAPISLERTGPFMPPITFPWLPIGGSPIVISEHFRQRLEAKGFVGIRFQSVVKKHIAKLNWHEWDRNGWVKEMPRREPEDYVRRKRHDPGIAALMGEVWELLPPISEMRLHRKEAPEIGFLDEFVAYSELGEFPTLFANRPDNNAYLIVDETGREWLEKEVGEWVKFFKVEMANR